MDFLVLWATIRLWKVADRMLYPTFAEVAVTGL